MAPTDWIAPLPSLLLAAVCACGSVEGDDRDDASAGDDDAATAADAGDDPGADAGPPCSDGNYLLSFDGQQFVHVPDSNSLRPSGDLTIEAWVRFDEIEPADYHCVAIKTFGNETADSYALWYDTGRLKGMVNLGFAESVPVEFEWAPVIGRWYFLAFTFAIDSHTQALYIDGEQVETIVNNQTPTYDDHPLTIGTDFGSGAASGQIIGRIDEVRILDVARTGAELAVDATSCPAGAAPGLRGYWRFNEGSGQTVQDSTGHGNLGTLGLAVSAESADPSWVLSTDPFPE